MRGFSLSEYDVESYGRMPWVATATDGWIALPEDGLTHVRVYGTFPRKIAYYAMLISHILLAAVNLPMILVTLWKAYKKDWVGHRRIARWTFPVWFYVSVTGVLVYFALYRWNAPPPA